MASFEKFTDAAVVNELRHNNRLINNDKNPDIDSSRTHLNYSLTPYLDIPEDEYYARREEIRKIEYEHYKQRKSECYVYNRDDIKTLAGCIVTLPKEITDPTEQKEFFKTVTSFLSDRYGKENVVSATVHCDEGKTITITDSNGDVFQEFHVGQPHLHLTWIPATEIDHAALSAKPHHCTGMDSYQDKVSANDVLTKHDLQTLHPDMQKYLDNHNVKGRVYIKPDGSGKNFNLSVNQMKEITTKTGIIFDKPLDQKMMDIISENEHIKISDKQLREQITELKAEVEVSHEKIKELTNEKVKSSSTDHEWGADTDTWGKQQSTNTWGHDNDHTHTY